MIGYIYILTNPMYPGYVKIGYAQDIKARLSSLNTGMLRDFECYALYETPTKNADLKIHNLIQLLNPILQAVKYSDKIKGKEFYRLEPYEAYRVLELIAEASGTEKGLYKTESNGKRINPPKEEKQLLPTETEPSLEPIIEIDIQQKTKPTAPPSSIVDDVNEFTVTEANAIAALKTNIHKAFIDGVLISQYPKTYAKMYVDAISYLYKTYPEKMSELAASSWRSERGKKKSILMSLTEDGIRVPELVENRIYVEKNLSAQSIVKIIARLHKEVSGKPSDFVLLVSSKE